MDTYWFAVDDEGQVACFETSEAGAVPHAAHGAAFCDAENFDGDLLVVLLVARGMLAGTTFGSFDVPKERTAPGDTQVLHLVPAGPADAIAANATHAVVRTTQQQLPVDAVAVYIDEPGELWGESQESAPFGLFHYWTDSSQDPDLYSPAEVPSDPLHIDEIGEPEIAKALRQLRLPTFGDQDISLRDHMDKMSSWGGDYDAAAGRFGSAPSPAQDTGTKGASWWSRLFSRKK